MPLPNGVDPWGRIQPLCPSAGYLGNRGILHDADSVVTKQWKNIAWVTCAFHFKGRNRKPFMQPNKYTELFFLDEATSLAVGHRPCGECRKEQYKLFKAAWLATQKGEGAPESIGEIDKALHASRVTVHKTKKTFQALLSDLPHGVFFEYGGHAYLHCENGPLIWTARGYKQPADSVAVPEQVQVFTPLPIVQMIQAGYTPQVHESASKTVLS